jgi:hypothetical protein
VSAKFPRVPKYRLHEGTNRAIVRIDGGDVYIGRYDAAGSRAKNAQIIGTSHATGLPPVVSRPFQEAGSSSRAGGSLGGRP